jgi:zinc transporter ZupT
MDEMDLAETYKIFYPIAAGYIFFSAIHRTLPKIDHIPGHKANLKRYKQIEITFYILTDHNGIESMARKTMKTI